MQYEQYGVWGGMTSQERISMRNPEKYPNQRERALDAFSKLGITYREIKECVGGK